MEAVLCYGITLYTLYFRISLLVSAHYKEHHRYWNLIQTPFGYPIADLCLVDPVALDMQDQHFHILHQSVDEVDFGVGLKLRVY